MRHQASVVDDDINAAVDLHCPIHQALALIEIGYIGLYCRIVAQQKLPGEGHASGDVVATASGFGRDESCADCQRTARAISDLPLFVPNRYTCAIFGIEFSTKHEGRVSTGAGTSRWTKRLRY